MILLFEWISGRGDADDGALTAFRARLQIPQQAQLDAKTLLLEGAASIDDLPGVVVGPMDTKSKGRKKPKIYKLQVGRKISSRPLLCKGPLPGDDRRRVLTFLVGATERDRKFHPRNAPAKAIKRFERLVSGEENRRRYETPPES